LRPGSRTQLHAWLWSSRFATNLEGNAEWKERTTLCNCQAQEDAKEKEGNKRPWNFGREQRYPICVYTRRYSVWLQMVTREFESVHFPVGA